MHCDALPPSFPSATKTVLHMLLPCPCPTQDACNLDATCESLCGVDCKAASFINTAEFNAIATLISNWNSDPQPDTEPKDFAWTGLRRGYNKFGQPYVSAHRSSVGTRFKVCYYCAQVHMAGHACARIGAATHTMRMRHHIPVSMPLTA